MDTRTALTDAGGRSRLGSGGVDCSMGATYSPTMEKGFSLQHVAAGDLEAFLRAVRDISSSLDMNTVLERFMAAAMSDLGAANCSLFLVDPKTGELELVTSSGELGERLAPGLRFKGEDTIPGWVYAHAESFRMDGLQTKEGRTPLTLVEAEKVKSVLCVPLIARGSVVGVAKLVNKLDGSTYSWGDEELFRAIASFLAIAIDNSVLHRRTIEQAELNQQLETAAVVQMNLLPSRMPVIDGLDVAGKSRFCQSVGGDYYDVLPTADGGLAVVVGDISGHGLPAAILMATARSYLRANRGLWDEPAELLEAVNILFTDDTFGSGNFLTMLFMRIFPDRRCFSWVNAGHGPLLVYDPVEDEVQELGGADCPPLGVTTSISIASREFCACRAGNICVIGTDGLWEAHSPEGEMFGMQRLKDCISANSNETAAEIVDAILEEVKTFRGGNAREDDETVLVIRVG